LSVIKKGGRFEFVHYSKVYYKEWEIGSLVKRAGSAERGSKRSMTCMSCESLKLPIGVTSYCETNSVADHCLLTAITCTNYFMRKLVYSMCYDSKERMTFSIFFLQFPQPIPKIRAILTSDFGVVWCGEKRWWRPVSFEEIPRFWQQEKGMPSHTPVKMAEECCLDANGLCFKMYKYHRYRLF
jgi:hypothetical protein